jgi:hypothetical protein
MCNVGKMYRRAGYPARRQQILAVLAMLGAMCAVARAQIDVNETGLHDGEHVYGLYAPPTPIPYVNLEDITVFAWGETDPNLYLDASFYAYGLLTDANVVSSGAIAVTGTGGAADAHDLDARADADGRAYGIYSTYGLITNSGPIEATASGGTALSGATSGSILNTTASGRAFGLYADDGAIENAGAVTAVATGGSVTGTATSSLHEVFAAARACGLYLDEDDWYAYADRHLSNSGDLTVTATGGSAQGLVNEVSASTWAYGIEGYDAPVINSGRIVVAAAGGDALSTASDPFQEPGAFASAQAYGIESDDEDLSNSGAVTASATGGTATGQGVARASAGAEVIGIEASGESTTPEIAEVQNTGAIVATAAGGTASSISANAKANATAQGLAASYANVGNTGPISVTAQAGTALAGGEAQAYATAYGCFSGESGTLSNSGDITATALGGTASGQDVLVYAYATGLPTAHTRIDNSGAITVIAQAGDMLAANRGFAAARAIGILANNNDVTNSGDISVTAQAGAAGIGDMADADAYGIAVATANVNNSGDITVTAAAGDGFGCRSYGILFAGEGTLTNVGVIRATGDTAYELYMEGGSALTLIDTYNVALDGDPDQGSIYVGDAATLALNGATLTVSAVSGETLWDTEYRLFETAGTGVVDGNFAEVRAVNPNTTAHYYDQNSVDSADDAVSLAYTPVAAPTLASAAVEKQAIAQAVDVVNHHMTTVLLQNILFAPSSGLLASAGSTAESLALVEGASGKSVGVFVEPYYSRLDKDADPLGYDARLWGFSAGYERYLGDTLLGLHLGYGQSDIDYTGAGYRGNSEDQDVVTGGLSGLTRWDPWVLHYGLTGFYGSHDYQGLTGLALDERETASYDSYGMAATLMAGHIFRWDSHVLLPEAGLNWLWVHRQRYTTEATDPSWDATYPALDDHDLYAAASVRWLSSFLHDDVRVTPSAAVGIRHLLTDTEAS